MTTWRAAAGIQRVVMSALSKGFLKRPRVYNNNREALGTSISGAQDLPQGLAMGIFAGSDLTQRWTYSVWTARAQEEQEQAPPDMMTGQPMHFCLRREVPTDHEAHSQTQRRQLRRVATTELQRKRAPEAEAEYRARSRPDSGPRRNRTRAGLRRRA